jgi:hypothetical protein
MHKILLYLAYGWLTVGGCLHFMIDVLSQHLRGKRAPSAETMLYYGLNSTYAFGQILFGLVGLWLVWRAAEMVDAWPMVVLSLSAAAGWLLIDFVFIEYTEPKIVVAVFAGLISLSAIKF